MVGPSACGAVRSSSGDKGAPLGHLTGGRPRPCMYSASSHRAGWEGQMNDPVVTAAILLVVAVGGLALGFVARGFIASQAIKAAQDKSERIVAEARAQQKELILQAKEEQV